MLKKFTSLFLLMYSLSNVQLSARNSAYVFINDEIVFVENGIIDLTNSTPLTYTHASNYNGTSTPLNIEPYWILKYITGSNYSNWIHVQGDTAINPGKGFTMKGTQGSGNAQRFDFRGKPDSETIAGNYTNRFEITFKKNTLSTEIKELNSLKIYQNNNISKLTINNPNAVNIKSFELFDITGKLILRKKIRSRETIQSYSTKGLSEGIYIVNLLLENNPIISKKIIISNRK